MRRRQGLPIYDVRPDAPDWEKILHKFRRDLYAHLNKMYGSPNGCNCTGKEKGRHHSPYCEGWMDGIDRTLSWLEKDEEENG